MKFKRLKGFSLLEMMMVLVIVSIVMVMFVNISNQSAESAKNQRIAVQMQQILAGALAYYVNQSKWPEVGTLSSTSTLVTLGYIPSSVKLGANAFRTAYTVSLTTNANGNTTGLWTLSTTMKGPTKLQTTNAGIVAGFLPYGYSSGSTVYGSVVVPGQNLNNAMALNFAGIYNSSACVPAPVCPANMNPAIYVVPASVTGNFAPPTSCYGSYPSTCQGTTTTSLTGFSAFAVGTVNNSYGSRYYYTGATGDVPPTTDPNVADCAINDVETAVACAGISHDPSGTSYWRVCLTVNTGQGAVDPNRNAANGASYTAQQGLMMGSIAVFTRCVPTNGDNPIGTPINVWTYNSGCNN